MESARRSPHDGIRSGMESAVGWNPQWDGIRSGMESARWNPHDEVRTMESSARWNPQDKNLHSHYRMSSMEYARWNALNGMHLMETLGINRSISLRPSTGFIYSFIACAVVSQLNTIYNHVCASPTPLVQSSVNCVRLHSPKGGLCEVPFVQSLAYWA